MFALLFPLLTVASDGTISAPQEIEEESCKAVASHLSLRGMIGKDVELRADAEERSRAREDLTPVERPTGSLQDFVLTPEGEMRWAAVGCGGLLGLGEYVVLVPADRMLHEWNQDELVLTLDMSEEELKALPPFRMTDVEEFGLANVIVAAETSYRTGEAIQPVKQDMKSDAPLEFALATALCESEVHAMKDSFGTVQNGVVNLEQRKLDALLVSHGGTLGIAADTFVIPLEAAKMKTSEEGLFLTLAHSTEQLDDAVIYRKPKGSFIAPEALCKAREFFGLTEDSTRKCRETVEG